jgi:hypothetical protein
MGVTITAPSDVELHETSINEPDLFVLPAGPLADEKGLAWSEERQLAV